MTEQRNNLDSVYRVIILTLVCSHKRWRSKIWVKKKWRFAHRYNNDDDDMLNRITFAAIVSFRLIENSRPIPITNEHYKNKWFFTAILTNNVFHINARIPLPPVGRYFSKDGSRRIAVTRMHLSKRSSIGVRMSARASAGVFSIAISVRRNANELCDFIATR